MTWFEITLHHGPKLIHQRSDQDDLALDVTDRACEFLYAQMKLADDVTILDIFKLLDNPVLRTIFRRDYVNELLTEAALGPLVTEVLPHERIEYLELNQIWSLDSSSSDFTSVGKFGVTGKGIVLREDVGNHGMVFHNKGERINWGVSMTSVRELLHLPIRINSKVKICEEDVYAKGFGEEIQTGFNLQITLGTLIHSLLWELSWHGTPVQRDVRMGALLERKAALDASIAELVPYDGIFEASGDLPKYQIYPLFFDEVGSNLFKFIEGAIHDLEDYELAQTGLDKAFGRALVLKQEFANFTGRALRVAVSEAASLKANRTHIQYDPDSEYAREDIAWDNTAPVGREFGSPDYERLMEEDRVEFQAKLSKVVHGCRLTETSKSGTNQTGEFLQETINVQLALKELGQGVSVGVAAAVWEQYSISVAAAWMAGADTVPSAKKALITYVVSQPPIERP